MLLTTPQSVVLKAVAQFQKIEKYHGTMPRKHALAYGDDAIEELVAQGLVEWAKFTYGCGKQLKGLRLTVKGQRELDLAGIGLDGPRPSELAYEHLLILQDLYHFCRMPRYRRMMPEKKSRHYLASDFEDLVSRGYILKVRLKAEGGATHKGFVISSKGERALGASTLV
uniref:Uncharacterized protein n=1 Tax=Fundidesulfovibrio putealis TaxID=270496 RepID=A0A7C3W9T0_9BACT